MSEIFRGVSEFLGGLKFSGGSEIFGGMSEILGGCLKFFFLFFSISFPPKKSFWDAHTTPSPETVNARPVRILLECILVSGYFDNK